jgi:hypothetical protein
MMIGKRAATASCPSSIAAAGRESVTLRAGRASTLLWTFSADFWASIKNPLLKNIAEFYEALEYPEEIHRTGIQAEEYCGKGLRALSHGIYVDRQKAHRIKFQPL